MKESEFEARVYYIVRSGVTITVRHRVESMWKKHQRLSWAKAAGAETGHERYIPPVLSRFQRKSNQYEHAVYDTIRYDTTQYIYVRSKADDMASLI